MPPTGGEVDDGNIVIGTVVGTLLDEEAVHFLVYQCADPLHSRWWIRISKNSDGLLVIQNLLRGGSG